MLCLLWRWLSGRHSIDVPLLVKWICVQCMFVHTCAASQIGFLLDIYVNCMLCCNLIDMFRHIECSWYECHSHRHIVKLFQYSQISICTFEWFRKFRLPETRLHSIYCHKSCVEYATNGTISQRHYFGIVAKNQAKVVKSSSCQYWNGDLKITGATMHVCVQHDELIRHKIQAMSNKV